MFFVSEEFLRQYEAGTEPASTLDETVKPGESLFPAKPASQQAPGQS
jgi:hypothetical protein